MSWEQDKERIGKKIVGELYKYSMIKTWYKDKPEGWKLISGLWSPFYIQLRPLASYPKLLKQVGYAISSLIKEECSDVNRIIGIAATGIPIATAVSIIGDISSCYTRKLEGVKSPEDFNRFIKTYGEHSMIEGILADGDTIGFIDDLVTKFDSKAIALKQLEFEAKERGLKDVSCANIIVVLDREQGAEKIAKKNRINLHSLIPFASKGLPWLKDVFADQEYKVIIDYLYNPRKYQDPSMQKELLEIALQGQQKSFRR